MKKLLIFAVTLCMLFTLVPHAHAAGTASLSGPSTVRAGDTITLSFRAGGGILGGNGTLSYDSSLLTFNGFSQTIGGSWVTELTGNHFVFYDNAMSNPIESSTTIFTLSFTVKANVAPGTPISVTASATTLSDGNQDFGVGSPSWSTTVAAPLSDNCDLASLALSTNISPAFDPKVTGYTASVPFATSSVTVNAKAADSNAKVSVSNPGLAAGGTTEIRVTVTAENGATKTYTVRVTRAQDPNYVPSSNADLEGITVTGTLFELYYNHEKHCYYLWLPYETESVALTGKAADAKASVAIDNVPAPVAGGVVTATVTVTAEDGTQQAYPVHMFRAPALADMESFFQAVKDFRDTVTEPTEPSEPVPTQPAETTIPTEPIAPPPTTPIADEVDTTQADLLLWVILSLFGGVLLGFTVTFLATRPRKKY